MGNCGRHIPANLQVGPRESGPKVDDVSMGAGPLEWGCPSTLPTMAARDWLSTATFHVGTWGQSTWKAEGSSLGLERLLDLPLTLVYPSPIVQP